MNGMESIDWFLHQNTNSELHSLVFMPLTWEMPYEEAKKIKSWSLDVLGCKNQRLLKDWNRNNICIYTFSEMNGFCTWIMQPWNSGNTSIHHLPTLGVSFTEKIRGCFLHVDQQPPYLQDGAPEAYCFRGCDVSLVSPHLQPWFFIGFAGTKNYLITRVPGPFL